ncbi:MAG TPA: biosynthetic-type acetolactate synthase large subunit [Syntrophorhabdaceae bacterium]|nr:biosynthetic-type acetolactate synthase large subunit [Syntrophorhabdaceae bacterium]
MKRTGAEIIIEALERQGVQIIAGIPGGANLPIYNALYESPIRHILARHEQGAGFIAQGMARSTGKAAVCVATSGPGVTNLITAIADAKLDSIPLIAVTGQVSRQLIGTDAFQEVDAFGLTMNLTKQNYLVRDAGELPYILEEAFHIAQTGRPGPVLIDVPRDVQLASIDMDAWPEIVRVSGGLEMDIDALMKIARMINEAKRPLIYAGGGIIHARGADSLRSLARKNSIPVALTLMGLGAFSPEEPLYLGMLGMHGAPCTNYILDEIDLLLAFGVRFDDRAIGKINEFCPQASIVHIDIDHAEIDKIKKANISLAEDIGEALKLLEPLTYANGRQEWIRRVERIKNEHPLPAPETDDPYHPLNVIRCISRFADSDAIVTTDVGQHQMWVAQAYPFREPRTLLTSGGLGTMGFGLPAAIGAALAHPGRQIICVSGDGSIQMNIQEMATLAELDLNIAVIVMNNQRLGLVRQQQELFFHGNYIASSFPSRLDFAAIARQFGIKGVNLGEGGDPVLAMEEILKQKTPRVIDVPIRSGENVFPMVPPGSANREMIIQNAANLHVPVR